MDILKAIRRIQLLLNTKISIYHIYGHQDSTKSYNQLTREAQLNVQVNREAQYVLGEAFEQNKFVQQPIFPCEGYQLWLHGRKV